MKFLVFHLYVVFSVLIEYQNGLSFLAARDFPFDQQQGLCITYMVNLRVIDILH